MTTVVTSVPSTTRTRPRSRRAGDHGRPRPNKVCVECGAPFYAQPSRFDRRHYCSIACRNRAARGERPACSRLPEEPASWVDSLPKALALVEAQLAEASGAEASVLEIERDALRWCLANPDAPRWVSTDADADMDADADADI